MGGRIGVRRILALAAVAATATVAVAVVAAHRTGRTERTEPLRHLAATEDYLPGLAADVFVPDGAHAAPVVVLVPGGSWRTADRSGLLPLADDLAGHGILAVAIRYRAADDGVRFPVPVADIVCAADFAAARGRAAGMAPGPLVLLGHSSGAHLAALAALAPERFRNGCPYPPAGIDGFVGLAGPYDVQAEASLAEALFAAPLAGHAALWRAGDPRALVAGNPGLAVLLAHGADDVVVPPASTTDFAGLLARAGHPVQAQMVPGADHATIYRPEVVGSRLVTWLRALPTR